MFELPEMYLLNEEDSKERREELQTVGKVLSSVYGNWDSWSDDDRTAAIVDYLKVASDEWSQLTSMAWEYAHYNNPKESLHCVSLWV